MKCATAQAIVEGMLSQKFTLTWESIDFEISSSSTPEEVRTAIDPLWGVTTGDCSDKLDDLIDYAFELEGMSTGHFREVFEAAYLPGAKNEVIMGLSCWLCDTGQIPEDTAAYTSAALFLLGSDAQQFLIKWLGWALECKRTTIAQIAAETVLGLPCTDCATLTGVTHTCEQWTAQFGEWTYQFDLNLNDPTFQPITTGFATSQYLVDRGIAPLYEIGGAGNNSCLAAQSTGSNWRMKQMDIGFENPIPYDGQIQIDVIAIGGMDSYTIILPVVTSDDFFTTPIVRDIPIEIIEIQLVNTSGDCTDVVDPTPVLRYVTYYGIGSNPFPLP